MATTTYNKQRIIEKEIKMTDEVTALAARIEGDGQVPHPSTVILPEEWNEFTKAAWFDRQLDAYNEFYNVKPN